LTGFFRISKKPEF